MNRSRCVGAALLLSACVTSEPATAPGADYAPSAGVAASAAYYPPPESGGGWRRLVTPNLTPTAQQKSDIRSLAGLDWDILKRAWDASSQYGGSFLVIRHGYIAAEWGTSKPLVLASCTKTLTSLGMHRIFQMSADGGLAAAIDPSSFAYQYLPASWGQDPTRQTIRIGHLLTMSSGLEPDDKPPAPSAGTSAYEQKLLAPPVRTQPGVEWSYASLPVDVLSLVAEQVTGAKLGTFWQQEIGARIGVSSLTWGALGAHTYASAYASASARDLARIAYLLLRRGEWNGTTIVSPDRIDAMTQWDPILTGAVYGPQIQFPTDPETQQRYGRLTWTNRTGSSYVGSGVPTDAYYCAGFRTNFFLVVPSLDLILVRLQSGPAPWSDAVFATINSTVVSAVAEAPPPSNAPPTAQITIPQTGATFPAPGPVAIAATATDADGSVTQVEFLADGALIGTDTEAPYEISWANVAAGTHELTARSTDDAGSTTTSPPVTISVSAGTGNIAPTIAITSPAPNASFAAGSSIGIKAAAQDADGTIARVVFLAGSTVLGTDRTTPYGLTWSNVPAGSYTLRARAVDNLGAKTVSSSVRITVRAK
jgi:CubicO group peptidase (beta-lactamase class C family)